MIKGFQDIKRAPMFRGFPNLNQQMDNSAYGFSGCKFWLDAAYGLDTQTNLGAISTWVEKVRGYKFVQGTAGNQPRLLTSDAGFNNLPVVDFQSSTRSMTIGSGDSFGVGTNATIAFVFKKTGDAAGTFNANALFTFSGLNAGQLVVRANNAAVGIQLLQTLNSGSNWQWYATGSDTNTHIVVIVKNGSTVTFYLDGVAQTVVGTWPSVVAAWNNVGGNGGTLALFSKLAEAIIWDSALDPQAVSANINTKYAIY